MRDYSTCIHEAGHAIIAKHFGATVRGIEWHEEGKNTATTKVQAFGLAPEYKAAIAAAGLFAQRWLAPDPSNSFSDGDIDIMEDAYEAWSEGKSCLREADRFKRSVFAETARLVKLYEEEIRELADQLHEGGDVQTKSRIDDSLAALKASPGDPHLWRRLETEVRTIVAQAREEGDEAGATELSKALQDLLPAGMHRAPLDTYETKVGGPPRPWEARGGGS